MQGIFSIYTPADLKFVKNFTRPDFLCKQFDFLLRKCCLHFVSQKMKILRGKLTPQIIPPCEEVNLVRTLNPLGSVVPLAMFCCRNVNFNYQSTHSVFLTALLILSTIKYFRFFSKAFLLYILSRKKHSELEGESVHFFFTLQNSHFQSH